jgi:uncharacterized coiled-coil protein SlyX
MNDQQILAIALASAPTTLTVLIGMLVNNARLSDIKSDINARLGDLNARIAETNAHIAETNGRIAELRSHMDLRFDETKELWRSELHRVEEILDARLKHLENR